MKKIKLSLLLVVVMLLICSTIEAQSTKNYTMKFHYLNKDTILGNSQIAYWANTGQFPDYLKWVNTPFALQKTTSDNIGLFTDSTTSFSAGQDVGIIFIKVQNTGAFINDYIESNIGAFISNAGSENVSVNITGNGLMMKAINLIEPNTQIIYSYQDILNLFAGDNTVRFKIFSKQ